MEDPKLPTVEGPESPSAQHNEPSIAPSQSQTAPSTQSRRRGRSGTRWRDITLSRTAGQKIPIEFDRYWKPIGLNASRYRSFVGLLARNKPSILIEEWRNVNDRVKQQIWDTIQV